MSQYILETKDLTKIFKIPLKTEGFYPKLKSLFAPEYSSFEAVR